MRTAVVTMTAGNRPELLERCKASVNTAIAGMDAEHIILPCHSKEDFQKMRWESLQLAEFVTWVDDDDWINPQAIYQCMVAMDEHNASATFTNEVIVRPMNWHANGKRRVSYGDAQITPNAIHHLTIMRTSQVHKDCYTIAEKLGIGIEWLCKASAAFHGAIHVPINGYYWNFHGENHSRTSEWMKTYRNKTAELQAVLYKWAVSVRGVNARTFEKIPQYV